MSGRSKFFCTILLAVCLVCLMPLGVYAERDKGEIVTTEPGDSVPEESGSIPQSSSSQESNPSPEGSSSPTSPTVPSGSSSSAKSSSSQKPPSAPKASSSRPSSSSKPSSRYVPAMTSKVDSKPDDASSFLPSSFVSSEPEAPSSSEIILPGVESVSETDPLASAAENRTSSRKMTLYGILAWACIALGIAVVLIVVLSNRRPPRGPGRSRYHRPKRGGRHLLDDKYYRHVNRY